MEIQKVKISVILPVFNGEKFITEAVNSILNQTYSNFELIIIDDCSTDNTRNILREFEKDVRVRVIHNETNLKVVASLNKGIQLSKGDYIARMDADDISHPERFEKQVALLDSNPNISLCASWVQTFGAETKVMRAATEHEHIKVRLFFVNPIFHPSVMFRKNQFVQNGPVYNNEYINAEDYILWVEQIDRLQFTIIPEVLLKYRIHNENVSVLKESNKAVLDEIHFKVYRHFLNKLQVSFTGHELSMHRKLGLVKVGSLTLSNLEEYLHWLKKLTTANNKVGYFNKVFFNNVILSYILYLTKQTTPAAPALRLAYKIVGNQYKLFDCVNFLLNRTRVKLQPAKSF